MQSWLAGKLIRRNMRHLNAGNVKPLLRMDARDVELRFPGDNSWSGVYRGKRELRPWLERFYAVGLQIAADEVILKGFPWRQTIAVRGTDQSVGPEGLPVYENRYVIWGHLHWGRLKRYEVYEDTLKSGAFDEFLKRTGHPAAGQASSGPQAWQRLVDREAA